MNDLRPVDLCSITNPLQRRFHVELTDKTYRGLNFARGQVHAFENMSHYDFHFSFFFEST